MAELGNCESNVSIRFNIKQEEENTSEEMVSFLNNNELVSPDDDSWEFDNCSSIDYIDFFKYVNLDLIKKYNIKKIDKDYTVSVPIISACNTLYMDNYDNEDNETNKNREISSYLNLLNMPNSKIEVNLICEAY
jgi:hypothetical protein